jgi:hypothetical protein
MMLESLNAKKPKKYEINNDAWDEIVRFAEDARTMGAKVVLAFPNIYKGIFDAELNRDFFTELKKRSKESNIPLIGEPEDRVFDEKHAYDTVYHQNTIGQMHSTDVLYWQLVNANIL